MAPESQSMCRHQVTLGNHIRAYIDMFNENVVSECTSHLGSSHKGTMEHPLEIDSTLLHAHFSFKHLDATVHFNLDLGIYHLHLHLQATSHHLMQRSRNGVHANQ